METKFNQEEYRAKRMELLEMINHYEINNRDMEAQIAINNREIAKLRFELDKLVDNSLNEIEEEAA